jgi:hypothetical protein
MLVLFFGSPRNLSNHMDRQACSGDTVLVNREEEPNSAIVAIVAGGKEW